MAITSFEGFVNKQVGSPVFVLKVAESHRKKDESGEWVNDGKTFFDVKAGYESGIDLAQFGEGARIKVSGRQKTVSREHNGTTYYTLTVAAGRIEVVEARGGGFNGGSQQSWANTPVQDSGAPSGGFGNGFTDEESQPF